MRSIKIVKMQEYVEIKKVVIMEKKSTLKLAALLFVVGKIRFDFLSINMKGLI